MKPFRINPLFNPFQGSSIFSLRIPNQIIELHCPPSMSIEYETNSMRQQNVKQAGNPNIQPLDEDQH
jgi:hypothetical protein